MLLVINTKNTSTVFDPLITLGCSPRVLAFARARGGAEAGARSPAGSGNYAQEPEAEDVTRGANRNANIVVHRARGRAQPASAEPEGLSPAPPAHTGEHAAHEHP